MTNLKQENAADKQLIVGSLKVLHGIDNKGLTTIRRSVNNLEQSVSSFTEKTENYWKDIADDKVITPGEKKELKKRFNNITQTYTAILKIAAEKSVLSDETIVQFQKLYNDLYTYLFKSLRVFDDLAENTEIPDLIAYNKFFNDYYEYETMAQNIINKSSYATIRQLNSLDDPGNEGEIVLYGGKYYQFKNGIWKKLNESGYMGIYSVWPNNGEQQIDRYFLADGRFYINNRPIKTKSGKYLKTKSGKILGTRVFSEKGFIYNCEETGFEKIEDKNDYRYIIAVNDLLKLNLPISDYLKGFITNTATDIANGLIDKSNEENRPGDYLGSLFKDPEKPKPNDYYLFSGTNTTERLNGTIYQWKKSTGGVWRWVEKSSSDVNNYSLYMTSLKDMLVMQGGKATEGLFTTVFAKSLVACGAFIENLATKVIELQNGGIIQSDNFSEIKKTGFRLKYDGDAEFMGNTHIGGQTRIDGDTIITGNAELSGNINTEIIKARKMEIPAKQRIIAAGTYIWQSSANGEFYAGLAISGITGKCAGYTFNKIVFDVQMIDYNPGSIWTRSQVIYNDWYIGETCNVMWNKFSFSAVLKLYIDNSLISTIYGNAVSYEVLTNVGAPIPYNIELNYNEYSRQTLKFENLLTYKPGEPNIVWNDNGTLKIS